MGQLRILVAGRSPAAQAQARGKLFEHLMAEVHCGFRAKPIAIPG